MVPRRAAAHICALDRCGPRANHDRQCQWIQCARGHQHAGPLCAAQLFAGWQHDRFRKTFGRLFDLARVFGECRGLRRQRERRRTGTDRAGYDQSPVRCPERQSVHAGQAGRQAPASVCRSRWRCEAGPCRRRTGDRISRQSARRFCGLPGELRGIRHAAVAGRTGGHGRRGSKLATGRAGIQRRSGLYRLDRRRRYADLVDGTRSLSRQPGIDVRQRTEGQGRTEVRAADLWHVAAAYGQRGQAARNRGDHGCEDPHDDGRRCGRDCRWHHRHRRRQDCRGRSSLVRRDTAGRDDDRRCGQDHHAGAGGCPCAWSARCGRPGAAAELVARPEPGDGYDHDPRSVFQRQHDLLRLGAAAGGQHAGTAYLFDCGSRVRGQGPRRLCPHRQLRGCAGAHPADQGAGRYFDQELQSAAA